jgi:TonB family protein
VRVVGSSGRADVDRKALESIRAWRLQPAISNGMAVEGVYLGTFIYKR